MVEHCWFVYGLRVNEYFVGYQKFHAQGEAASVEFSWKKAMNPFLIGWRHTHPSAGDTCSGLDPSALDDKTMRSWVRARARSFICGITCDDETKWYEYRRSQKGYIVRSDFEIEERGIFLVGSRIGPYTRV